MYETLIVLFQLLSGAAFLLATYFIGKYLEKNHYENIYKREEASKNIPVVNLKNCLIAEEQIKAAYMVQGSVVMGIDHFRKVVMHIKKLIGGEISTVETVMDLARREAILRMKESAPHADVIANLRLETSSIGTIHGHEGGKKNSINSVEVIAYGTAIEFAN